MKPSNCSLQLKCSAVNFLSTLTEIATEPMCLYTFMKMENNSIRYKTRYFTRVLFYLLQ